MLSFPESEVQKSRTASEQGELCWELDRGFLNIGLVLDIQPSLPPAPLIGSFASSGTCYSSSTSQAFMAITSLHTVITHQCSRPFNFCDYCYHFSIQVVLQQPG